MNKCYLDKDELVIEFLFGINQGSLGYLQYELDCEVQDHIDHSVGEIVFAQLHEGIREHNFSWEVEMSLIS